MTGEMEPFISIQHRRDFDIVGFVERHLPGAVRYAEREQARIERSRRINIQRMRDRGTCFVGHSLTLPRIPINSLGTAPCGYCTSARAEEPA